MDAIIAVLDLAIDEVLEDLNGIHETQKILDGLVEEGLVQKDESTPPRYSLVLH